MRFSEAGTVDIRIVGHVILIELSGTGTGREQDAATGFFSRALRLFASGRGEAACRTRD